MKKFIKLLLIILFSLTALQGISYAADDINSQNTSQTTTVITTEAIPGANCVPYKGSNGESVDMNKVETKKFTCTIKSGMESFFDILKGLVKYFLFIAVLVIVLMIALSGVRMSIAGKNEAAKKQFIHLIQAILIIFLMGSILKIVAPWIYQ